MSIYTSANQTPCTEYPTTTYKSFMRIRQRELVPWIIEVQPKNDASTNTRMNASDSSLL